ncbi:hypothetical protein QQF64_006540 [Cirrhinus molitorella]|uniref:Zinc finger BED domain-containing protein 5 n=1 Tax=Cirrhinus molitorella TaxID=172907 RepID=A0ABR3M827_9TELE
MGVEHEQLLFHTEVRWLSRGRVLQRLYKLRSEVKMFLVDVKSDLARYLDDPLWLAQLAYLVDIFDRLNLLNTMQGRDASILILSDKLSNATIKLLLPFTSVYLCEAGFPKLTALKTKYRNRLQVEDDIRLALSNTEPQIPLLCEKKQAQVSH